MQNVTKWKNERMNVTNFALLGEDIASTD